MSFETWLKTANLFQLIPALQDDCKLLKVALLEESLAFEFKPLDPKWASFVASLASEPLICCNAIQSRGKVSRKHLSDLNRR
jgi:hypothetical protein